LQHLQSALQPPGFAQFSQHEAFAHFGQDAVCVAHEVKNREPMAKGMRSSDFMVW
jgi:hypothetical protein